MTSRMNPAKIPFHLLLFGVCLASLSTSSAAKVASVPTANQSARDQKTGPTLYLSCPANNDLYCVLVQNQMDIRRFDTPAAAIDAAPHRAGVLILASRYPTNLTAIDAATFAQAKSKQHRLYIEFPERLPELDVGRLDGNKFERAVVTSDLFGSDLPRLSLLGINGLRYVAVNVTNTDLVAARVAGFDHAVYGLPKTTHPLLFRPADTNLLVATTALSRFITGRYGPTQAWQILWQRVLTWLAPQSQVPELSWTPLVRPSYGREEPLPPKAENQSLRRAMDWFIKSKLVANYGDDNARLLLGTMAASALLGDNRWDEAMMQCLLANLRTTGRRGFRGDRLDLGPLGERGWQYFFEQAPVNLAPHFEAYLWACFLWAYHQTGDEIFLTRTLEAIRTTMQAFPKGLRWTNGLAQERARMLLPLAWLVRVDDTAEHREWLRQAVEGLLALQEPCGSIREELGPPGQGLMPPPRSNEEYGLNEASLIQQDGDPVADLLYTVNFAFLGLHEASAAVKQSTWQAAEDKLAQFLVRVQIRSDARPELDGGWFRAFDLRRWEAWASNADAGWGAWVIESGWTEGWIASVLALRQMKTSLWELTESSQIEKHYAARREQMLPETVLHNQTSEK